MGKLTVQGVRTAKPGRHVDGDGLCLLVKPSGARSWLLRAQHMGRRRDIGLGSVDFGPKRVGMPDDEVPILKRKLLTLAEAREKAALLRKLLQAGLDPVLERDREKRRIPSFAEAVEMSHAEFKKGWKDKHAAAFKASLETHIVPRLGNQRVDMIDSAMVRDALAPIWTDKPVIARKLRVRVNQVLGFCKSRNWRTHDLPDAKEVRSGLAKHKRDSHFEAMPFGDVPGFFQHLVQQEDTAGRLALCFAIVTAARSGEVRKATWAQINFIARNWTRPEDIMKKEVKHVIPLNDQACDILERAKSLSNGEADDDALIFPGRGQKMLSDMTLTKALRTSGHQGITVHGFRSSFRDWAAETMPTIPNMVVEMALSHKVGTQTERAYLRTDMLDFRRTLTKAWGDYLAGATEEDVAPEVHRIREARD